MAFDVVDQDITQLFKNDDIFCIPRYQRNYVWNELNWTQLLKDIRYCAEVTPEWSHFIGSVVFERKQKSGGLVDIIDGQQRIITLQIVIFAMIYCYNRIKKVNDVIEIKKRCDTSIDYLLDLIRNKTLGKDVSIKVNNPYKEFIEINQTLIDLNEGELIKYDTIINSEKKVSSVVVQAFKFYVKEFLCLDIDKLELLTNQFLKTRVVAISSLQEEEVYNIFEILNARGVKLKQVELLKNYLFKYLKPRELLDTYKDKWADLETLLEGIDLDDYYLHVFRCWHYKRQLTKEQLFEVTKDQLRGQEMALIPQFFDFFINCSKYYRMINDAQGNIEEKEIYEYFKLKNNKQIRSVLLALKIKREGNILADRVYLESLTLIRNFFIAFNLDNGVSNQLDNDVYMLSNMIYQTNDEREIEHFIIKFLMKFSTYFTKKGVLENGLKSIIYSNKSIRKNTSSKILVYFFKPLLLECEKNHYVQYDFTKFNVEHILNDDENEDIRYSLGNLLLCPNEINSRMRNQTYDKKRKILLESGIPYLVDFGERYVVFNEECIEERTEVVIEKLKKLYVISKEELEGQLLKLQLYFELEKQLIIAFGTESVYVKKLHEKGYEKFIEFVYKNGSLPKGEVEIIKSYVRQDAV